MNVLFIHQNFPGQFIHLSAHLAAKKRNRVVALTMRSNPAPPNVAVRKYSLLRNAADDTHPMLRDEEAKILRAEACASAAFSLKREGFVPDVIVAHPGWGEALFIKDVFPSARLILYCEYFYAPEGQDVGFDPEDPPITFEQKCRIRLKNTVNLHSLDMADAAVSPTEWQKSTYPIWAQQKIEVIHDGIDSTRLKFNAKARITLTATRFHPQLTFKPGDEILTYVARNLEPVRGFHVFMRALPKVLSQRKNAHVIIVGGDQVSYGRPTIDGSSWREQLLSELGSTIDRTRVHFVGKIPYQDYIDLIHVSRVHSYLTTPFVLSWSFLETAISGTPVIASGTPPVLEFAQQLGVVTHDFFDRDAWSESILLNLSRPTIEKRAKQLAHVDINSCLKRQFELIQAI